ncbi:acyl-CoA synthetase [Corynebacterium falsenii DSM 44353]|uniref:AMP-binding protein n=1 Tax=Corynebacterium falsenii TaxID=108486 RepID=UPI0003E93D07|nr:AMP-binding protein [Corynebacterium falsenii]AHI02664.1 acyl-CoA synthetase [Corynebacterium falsenii DSM 44353]UBI05449.1 AMP-binding protein [Corynebacterium falsenii]
MIFPSHHGLNSPLTPLRFLQRSATVHLNKVACVDGPRRITFTEFRDDAQALARALIDDGIQPGDRVGVLAPNSYEALLAQFAIPLAGGVIVAINTRLAPAEVNYILNHSDVSVLIADKQLIDEARPALDTPLQRVLLIAEEDGSEANVAASDENTQTLSSYLQREGDDLSYRIDDEHQAIAINYTSGTTGKPKGVIYTHRGAYLNALGQVQTQHFTHDTVYLWTLPMFHCSGWCTGWAAMAVSATQVAIRAVRGPKMWELIADEGVTAMCGAPAVLTTLVDDDNKRRVKNLRIVTAGAPPSPTIITRCENIGVEVTHVYGLTESYGPFTVCESQPEWTDMTVRRRAVLKARQGVATVTNDDVRVIQPTETVDDELIDVPADGVTMGEIVMTGNGVMNGYFKDEDATAMAFRGGWFHTGDLGVMHPDGYIQLLDRAKDVVVSGGENISTIEVEQAVVSYPDVSDCAVIGVPDDKWGERPRAYVVLRPEARGADEQAIQDAVIAHCRAHIAGYKVPRDIVILEDLPRTSTGKVRKNELRDAAWAGKEQRIN